MTCNCESDYTAQVAYAKRRVTASAKTTAKATPAAQTKEPIGLLSPYVSVVPWGLVLATCVIEEKNAKDATTCADLCNVDLYSAYS